MKTLYIRKGVAMDVDNIRCGYSGCPNPGEHRQIRKIPGVGKVDLSADMCDSHYDLHEIDGDVIDWLKGEWMKLQ
jgi:hypothetical protein